MTDITIASLRDRLHGEFQPGLVNRTEISSQLCEHTSKKDACDYTKKVSARV